MVEVAYPGCGFTHPGPPRVEPGAISLLNLYWKSLVSSVGKLRCTKRALPGIVLPIKSLNLG
jgi:hypothetical protein